MVRAVVTQNRPYDDRKVLVALRAQGLSWDDFDDVSIDVVYDDGSGEHGGATVHATFVWTVAAAAATAALDASDSVGDHEVGASRRDSLTIVPEVGIE